MGYWCPKCHNIFDDKFDKKMNQCKQCNSFDIVIMPENLNITMGELIIIAKISTDKNFCQSIINLKENDIIEYQLKLSQFKTQLEQQKNNKTQSNDKIKCPKCGSTFITTGARGVNFTFGLIGASKTVNRCAKCGHTWKP